MWGFLSRSDHLLWVLPTTPAAHVAKQVGCYFKGQQKLGKAGVTRMRTKSLIQKSIVKMQP